MTRTVMKDPALEKQFREDGYLVLRLLNDADIADLTVAYESAAIAHNQGFMASVLLDDPEMRLRINAELCRVFNNKVLPVLDDYRMAVGSIAAKEALSEDSSVGLHQDLSFVDERIDGQTTLSIWSPLIPVTHANGGLSVAKGSHVLNSNWRDPGSLPYSDLQNIIEEEFMAELPMQAGEVLIMDSRLFHSSPPNRSSSARAVAAGVAVPAECPIHYVHRDYANNRDIIEVWQVPADFYHYQTIGMRPTVGRLLGKISGDPEPLDEARLRATLRTTIKADAHIVTT
jgi:hypothetical protein